jgi:hypothetical protein
MFPQKLEFLILNLILLLFGIEPQEPYYLKRKKKRSYKLWWMTAEQKKAKYDSQAKLNRMEKLRNSRPEVTHTWK